MPRFGLLLLPILVSVAGCGDTGEVGEPKDIVRGRISSLAPSANIGHRGTGETRRGHPFPENSISSFVEAVDQGADGIELDVELTSDAELVVMHDDTLNRTTTCTGCVSALTLQEVRDCFLLGGSGEPTDERPPTLPEVYQVLPQHVLINVELKVFGPECLTSTTGPEALVNTAIGEIERLGGENRTFFSSFDTTAADTMKSAAPGLYSALLSFQSGLDLVEEALLLNQDAIHPFFVATEETVQAALGAGLQVNVWTVNTESQMNQSVDKGATAVITDEPGLLSDVLADR